jgi:hypothetical protein
MLMQMRGINADAGEGIWGADGLLLNADADTDDTVIL